MPLNIHWKLPVNLLWGSDTPLETTIEIEDPLENTTDNPLESATESTMISEVSISGVQSFAHSHRLRVSCCPLLLPGYVGASIVVLHIFCPSACCRSSLPGLCLLIYCVSFVWFHSCVDSLLITSTVPRTVSAAPSTSRRLLPRARRPLFETTSRKHHHDLCMGLTIVSTTYASENHKRHGSCVFDTCSYLFVTSEIMKCRLSRGLFKPPYE